MCSNCNNEHYHDEDCCCCECCEEEKELVRDRRELTDEEIESIIVEKYNTKDEKTKVFIRKALKVYKYERYNYSNVVYIDSETKVTIWCNNHNGFFEQTPHQHLRGCNCKICSDKENGLKKRSNTEDFIKKAIVVHNDRYDYSKVKYIKSNEKVEIICKVHNKSFWQTPNDHLSGGGCPECNGGVLLTKDDFIKRAKKVHGNKYDYSKVNYVNAITDVEIICRVHNKSFWQTPHSHLLGAGCPECNLSLGEDLVKQYLEKNNYIFNLFSIIDYGSTKLKPDFILTINNVWIEYNGPQHYKFIDYFHKHDCRLDKTFEDQLERDLRKRVYCKDNGIRLIEIPYTLNTYEKISDFLDKVLLQNIDPNTLVDYSKLYKLDNTGLNLEDLFPT